MKVKFLLLAAAAVLLLVCAAGRDTLFEETRSTVSETRIAEAPRPPRTSTKIGFREKVALVVADFFSVLLSFCPIIIHYHTDSWFVTRAIFPAKSVLCNFVAAAVWTFYMKIHMYLSSGYIGLDALIVNCAGLVVNMIVLICYFIKGKEYIKFVLCLVASTVLATVLIVVLVFYPYSTNDLTDKGIANLKLWSNVTAICGIMLFFPLNLIPFDDLREMTFGKGGYGNVTLNWPILLCTFLNCFVSFLRTFYAWVFPSDSPNYFMIANLIMATLSLIQFFWLGGICLHHRKVEGQIMDVENIRMSFLMLSETMIEMASFPAEHASWRTIGFFQDLADHVSNGAQSLSQIRSSLQEEVVSLQAKMDFAVDWEANIKVRATTLENNAKSIVAAAGNAANQGTVAAAAARLTGEETAALEAFQAATAAVTSSELPRLLGNQPQHQGGDGQEAGQQANRPINARSALELSKKLQEKAAEAVSASSSHLLATAKAAAAQVNARAAIRSCNDLIAACNMCIDAFQDISTAITNKIADTQDGSVLSESEAQILQKARIQALQTAISACWPRLHFIATRVRCNLQVIHATTEIPAPMREALRHAYEKLMVLKITADSRLSRIKLKSKLKWFSGATEPCSSAPATV